MKKARYVGGYRPGVEVTFHDENDIPHTITVDYNHELPHELEDGTAVPASVRDGLLASDDWSEVKRDAGKGS
jgi:hypothetical protein